MNQKPEYLHAKIQIGNCKGPISYNLDQIVFHYDDIPIDKRIRKDHVVEWKSKSSGKWDKTTKAEKPVCERRQMENYVRDRSNVYQYNYRAETLDTLRTIEPIDKPTKFHISKQLVNTASQILEVMRSDPIQRGKFPTIAEMPINPSLTDSIPWNSSVEINFKEVNSNLNQSTNHAMKWSKKVNATLGSPKRTYIGPIDYTNTINEEIRNQKKKQGRFKPEKRLLRPISAPVDRSLLRNRYSIEPPNEVIITQHSGVWETNKVDGRAMWSDTASEAFTSKGDVKKKINLDKQNLDLPANLKTTYFEFIKTKTS